MNELLYDIWFSAMLINKQDIYYKLVDKYGSPEEAFNNFTEIDLAGLSDKSKYTLMQKDISYAEGILKRCEKEDITVIGRDNDYYPEMFKNIDLPPVVLYAKGDISKLNGIKITVLGSRKCDQEGIMNTKRFTKAFCDAGLTIVAGFAEGIEANVHKTALSSIVILPCGINVTYPATHFRLKNTILDNGGLLITEYPFGVKAFKENFKPRNRLLAAISGAVVFVQCGLISGTSHTFNWAATFGKDAYVIPGSINNKRYDGNNQYIKDGGILITCPEDVLIDYFSRHPELIQETLREGQDENISPEISDKLLSLVDDDAKLILSVLSEKSMHIDEIVSVTKLSVPNASVSLMNLELLNIVEKCEGNRYRIK